MQVSSASSLTWLQSAGAAAGRTSPAASADAQDSLDASGAEGASLSLMMASLQSPSQLFSADGLSALISAQLGQSSTDPTSNDPSASSSAHHYHHHRGGGGAVEPSTSQSPDSTPAASPASASAVSAPVSASAADVETEMSQLLTGM